MLNSHLLCLISSLIFLIRSDSIPLPRKLINTHPSHPKPPSISNAKQTIQFSSVQFNSIQFQSSAPSLSDSFSSPKLVPRSTLSPALSTFLLQANAMHRRPIERKMRKETSTATATFQVSLSSAQRKERLGSKCSLVVIIACILPSFFTQVCVVKLRVTSSVPRAWLARSSARRDRVLVRPWPAGLACRTRILDACSGRTRVPEH